ncbi:ankyrin repeat-containing domain protein [Russula compacta]|nr:ankyrin repeat-containing domain protein [Russula compacta]
MGWKASGSLLWVHGKPESGKSVLRLDIKGISDAGSAHISYFFFDGKDTGKQDILSSIVIQLGHQSDSFCNILFSYHSIHQSGSQQPSDGTLAHCLEDMLRVPGQVPIYSIIDTLDEYPNMTGIATKREKVLMLVEKLVRSELPNLRLCVTSRPEVDIRTSNELLTSDRISLHDESRQKKVIVDFVCSVVYSDRNMRRWRDADKKMCLSVAAHPLDVEELAEVLAVDFTPIGGIPKLKEDWRWQDQERAVLTACSSLIAVVDDGRPRVVQFLHFSAKEFLTSEQLATSKMDASRNHYIRLEEAHTMGAQACLGVLLRLDYDIDRESIESFPLAQYAVERFSDHVEFEDVLSQIRNRVDDLLDAEKPHFSAWLWMCSGLYRDGQNQMRFHCRIGISGLVRPEDINAMGKFGTPLHAASRLGHSEMVELLLDHSVDVDVRDRNDRTPLHLAIYGTDWTVEDPGVERVKGMKMIIRILIGHNADTDARDNEGKTLLNQLLAHDIEKRDNEASTPLHAALVRGSVKIVQLLLKYGANIHVQDKTGRTPLHLAADDHTAYAMDVYSLQHRSYWSMGCVEAAQPLLEHGANLHAQNKKGRTSPHEALVNFNDNSYRDDFDIARLFLEHGVDV